ncbi:pirin family protein [Candidatus Nanohaloarchaea archaeon]|nr:pirin family protein [Candidatus Nanohaloarchaea archaeon]
MTEEKETQSNQQFEGRLVEGEMVKHGTGVNSRRAFPTSNYSSSLDPFVLFERFYIDEDKGFPMHPHKGFEIVSYMIEGGMAHEDSLGVKNTASEGEVMRITTGSGIRHSEFPANDKSCNGLQLWVNLPRDKKEIEAGYQDAEKSELPTSETEDAEITTVIGEGSPITLQTEMQYLDVEISGEWSWEIREGWQGFLFGVKGSGKVKDQAFGEGDVLTIEKADKVDIAGQELRIVAVQGKPHNQAIRQQGPYVF